MPEHALEGRPSFRGMKLRYHAAVALRSLGPSLPPVSEFGRGNPVAREIPLMKAE
jgi:hypothetical protein